MGVPTAQACKRVTGADLDEGRPVARALRHPLHYRAGACPCQGDKTRLE